jgi:Holliday junction resolvase RusA-like endonuclease
MRRHEPLQAAYDLAVHDAQRMAPKGFTVWLPRPPGVNGLYDNVPGRGRVKSRRYTAWIKEAQTRLMASRLPKVSGDYKIAVIIERPTGNAPDLDGPLKALIDIFVKQGLTDDDKHLEALSVAWNGKLPDKDAGVIITVEPV